MFRNRAALFILAVCLAGGCTAKPVVQIEDALNPQKITASIRSVLRHGDWMVTRGIHATDNIVATATNMPFSHAVIYDAENDAVIEAESASGVHATPLPELVAKSQRIMVIRPMWATEQTAHGAVEAARAWIGKKYNLTGLVGLNFPDRYYCTQLAVEAYRPYMTEAPGNPIPLVIAPGRMHHWGRVIYDTGP